MLCNLKARLIIATFVAWACTASLPLSAEPQMSTKDLFEYIRSQRKLGFRDEQIRRNALSSGWDAATIERTYSMLARSNQQQQPVSPPRSSDAVGQEYRIGAGDVLQIVVWKEAETSVPSAVVRVDGKISIPLIGEVEAAGLTTPELERSLVEKLSRYINSPVVTVIAAAVNSKKIYVMGGVRKEGPIALIRPMTVLQAINEAGGLAEFANSKKIYVLRVENGTQIRFPFDYNAVIKGKRPEQNIGLLPDDTVVVPQ